MPYVLRDDDGTVVALSEYPLTDQAEDLPPDHPEVLDFVGQVVALREEGVGDPFLEADLDFIRVAEDLIEALISKGVLALADLPAEAQEKLMARRALRHSLGGTGGLVGEDGD
ncbi:hypothetical protein [Magnetospirillum gryphiswaldense]|uniref:Tryptophan synthase subunit beta like protein n=1 Tax=Magnetospirillum gryphiswaldense TaxID=55518 RepID=A4TYC6_9PROT|nr:hypothetical protein [Magnetospirillum gryphiswaldense]AVM74748.1 hypothetical protein MSR1_22630 [Magnetospirillum gryphiswaldense MSR-1]AVM78651.1 hypothetical protein MSR1L_22630 [Magnetospirillum gryphiswaldense]CAM75633.1 conserved hypothetical protein [Magnetospirillum gryphiswaldense MSR-1]